MKVDLIAIDVDGTLIADDYRISDLTKAAVREAAGRGVRIVLCTGRGPVSTLPYLDELGLSGIAITHNGAATIDSVSRSALHQYSFPMSDVARLVAYCRDNGIHFDVNTTFDIHVERMSELSLAMYAKYLAKPISVDDVMRLAEPIVKFCVFAEGAQLERLEADWPLVGHADLRFIRSGDLFIDVMHPQANKGDALRLLAGTLGVGPERVLAIGNYYNDIEMLDFAGFSVAMGNSPDEVKARASAVTASNNEDGVGLAIQKYCL